MPPARDPYRTLGLAPGASVEEVRRAYRRLAKAYHPDTAGPQAMPRFLAIQQAYEALVDGRPSGSASGEAPAGSRPPWQADTDRARASRASWQSRAGRRPPPSGAADAEAGRRRRSGGRPRHGAGGQRPPDRATPGSTSYDFAEHEPFDPHWSGASWYGPSSGTYWTINPKEYADPRKHGPEYQARARRSTGNGAPGEPDPFIGASDADGATPDPSRPGESASRAGSGAAGQTAPRTEADAGEPAAPPRPRFVRREPAAAAAPAVPPAATIEDELIESVRSAGAARSRLALALVGWPPLGLGLAFVLGEMSGCGRFAATCVDGLAMGTWIGQLAILAVLILVPGVAALAAIGTLATLAAAIPVAVVLSAAGGSRDPATAGVVLGVTLVAAWIVGVAFAMVRRSRRLAP
jgi:hypothetical protein